MPLEFDLGSLQLDSKLEEFPGETRMLVCRWFYKDDRSGAPIAKTCLNAHMQPKRSDQGGVEIAVRYSIDIFEFDGVDESRSPPEPKARHRIQISAGDWDDGIVRCCADRAQDPVFEQWRTDKAFEHRLAKDAPALNRHYQQIDLGRAAAMSGAIQIPDPPRRL